MQFRVLDQFEVQSSRLACSHDHAAEGGSFEKERQPSALLSESTEIHGNFSREWWLASLQMRAPAYQAGADWTLQFTNWLKPSALHVFNRVRRSLVLGSQGVDMTTLTPTHDGALTQLCSLERLTPGPEGHERITA